MVISLINGYEIRFIDNEEVLYMYFDNNVEFGSFNKKKRNLKKDIKKYIKSNKIPFKGSLVAIMVGGVFAGTIMLNNYKKGNNSVISNSSKIVAIMDNYDYIEPDELLYEETISNDEIVNSEETIKKEVINTPKEEKVVESKNIEVKYIDELLDVNNDSSNYVTLYRKNGSIINIELEEYVIGVVGAEMPASFNSEALKAQAVLARTYALKTQESGKTLTDTNSTQNYKDNNELKSMWGLSYDTYYNKIKNAVMNTKGEYLTYNGKIIDAVYHSTSNGYTEDSIYVWGNDKPYLKSVESIYDNTNKSFIKTIFFSYEEMSTKLGIDVNMESSINIISKNPSNRVLNVDINGVVFKGTDFRNKLGLRSTDFDIELLDNGVNITTRGYGHGVGMSQYGANGMANNGSNYRDILAHYYTGVSFKSL